MLRDPSLPTMPARAAGGHKGTFGTVAVLGGSAVTPRVMVGGAALAALAGLRVGCGLAVLAVPEPLARTALSIAPVATTLALPVDDGGALDPSPVAAILDTYLHGWRALVVGPALGTGPGVEQVLVPLLAQGEVPLIVDADAINALAAVPAFDQDLRAPSVWTPHPGEFRRLAGALGLGEIDGRPAADAATDADHRPAAAEAVARRLGCVIVLKGAGTVVTDGQRTIVNQTGNVALATGGSGDVLSGVIAGLVAQFCRPHLGSGERAITPERQGGLGLFECAWLGVHLHGLAADLWAAEHGPAGMLATDLLIHLPAARAMLDGRG